MEQIASYVAPAATILAALITASNLGPRITGWGFVVYTLGALAWLAIGLTVGPSSLVWQNAILLPLDIFGIWRWLGRQTRIEEGGETAAKRSRRQEGETLFPMSIMTKAPVISTDGKDIGRCVDAMAGCSSGRLSYLVVAEGGVAGVGETLRRLPWDGCSVKDGQVNAPMPASQFCSLKALEPEHWPAH
jgi:hypothetical protein